MRHSSGVVRILVVALVLAGATAFAVLVWPTLYRPIPILRPSGLLGEVYVAARQNRVTGEVQWLRIAGDWVPQ